MKKICGDSDIEVCDRLRALLESRGIPCVLRAEHEPVLGGENSPLARPMPELWLVNDEQFDEAMALIHGEPPETSSDSCASSLEDLESPPNC